MLSFFAGTFGNITPPAPLTKYGGGNFVTGFIPFLNVILKLLVVIAGLYFLFNLILAGYQFISAGGDSKAIQEAWGKIWQSIVGLLIVAASFLLAAIFGLLIFNDWQAILNPTIYTPK